MSMSNLTVKMKSKNFSRNLKPRRLNSRGITPKCFHAPLSEKIDNGVSNMNSGLASQTSFYNGNVFNNPIFPTSSENFYLPRDEHSKNKTKSIAAIVHTKTKGDSPNS
jgi:hypothetical protein